MGVPYILVENFNGGLDRRKSIDTAPPGTLWELTNAHITRGGEIEKAKSFVSTFPIPAGSFGISHIRGTLYTFGSGADPGVPSGLTYQQLIAPGASPPGMSKIVDTEIFDGKLYVIAEYDDGSIYHFYNGTRVSFWDSGTVEGGSASNANIATAIANLIDADGAYGATAVSEVVTVTAAVAGVGFTASGSGSGSGTLSFNTTVANVAEVTEVLATGSFDITGGTSNPTVNTVASVTVNGVTVTSAAVDWVTSNEATATAVAANITAHTSTPNYTATSVGARVIISAVADSGSTPNAFAVVCVEAGDVTHSTEVAMAGGVDAVAPVAQQTEITVGGTWAAGDTYEITINATVFGGTTSTFTALTVDTKVYITSGSIIRFCKINDATAWDENITANIGAGFINISNHSSGSDVLTGLAEYQENLAIFARRAIQIWQVRADEEDNAKLQVINNTGSRSPASIISFTDTDILYLSDSGVRTLTPRDSSNKAITNDIGRPIDSLVLAQIAALTDQEVIDAKAIVEPLDGRYWLAMKNKIFVFSSFPASGQGNISAWSIYEPGFDVNDIISVNERVYVRSGDIVYLYGGSDNATYDNSTVTVQLPFLSVKKPADEKEIHGIDISCEGTWDIDILVNPDDLTKRVEVGEVDGTTYWEEGVEALGDFTHFAPKLVNTTTGYAKLKQIAVHHEELDT